MRQHDAGVILPYILVKLRSKALSHVLPRIWQQYPTNHALKDSFYVTFFATSWETVLITIPSLTIRGFKI